MLIWRWFGDIQHGMSSSQLHSRVWRSYQPGDRHLRALNIEMVFGILSHAIVWGWVKLERSIQWKDKTTQDWVMTINNTKNQYGEYQSSLIFFPSASPNSFLVLECQFLAGFCDLAGFWVKNKIIYIHNIKYTLSKIFLDLLRDEPYLGRIYPLKLCLNKVYYGS